MFNLMTNILFPKRKETCKSVEAKIKEEQANSNAEKNDDEDGDDSKLIGMVTNLDESHLCINNKYWASRATLTGITKTPIELYQLVQFRLEKTPSDVYKVVEMLKVDVDGWDSPEELKLLRDELKEKCLSTLPSGDDATNSRHSMMKSKKWNLYTQQSVNHTNEESQLPPVESAATDTGVKETDDLCANAEDDAEGPISECDGIPAEISVQPGETQYVDMNYGHSNGEQELTYYTHNFVGLVVHTSATSIQIQTESHNFNLKPSVLKLDYEVAMHDKLICVCRICKAEDFDTSSLSIYKLLDVKPGASLKNVTFAVRAMHEGYGELSDGLTYFLRDLRLENADSAKASLKEGDHVKVDVVPTGKDNFSWRCIRMSQAKDFTSNVMKVDCKVNDNLQRAVDVWATNNRVSVPANDSSMPRRRFVAIMITPYEVPNDLKAMFVSLQKREVRMEQLYESYPCLLGDEVKPDNYVNRFDTLIFLEEIEVFIAMRGYDMPETQFVRDDSGAIALYIENLADRRPSLMYGDSVRVYALSVDPNVSGQPFTGTIRKVLSDRILLKFNDSLESNIENRLFRVEFYYSRTPFRMQHYAVSTVFRKLGEPFLFPKEIRLREKPLLNVNLDAYGNLYEHGGRSTKWFQPDLNTVQKQAIRNVLRAETNGMPYIIFGPPGTGKTKTIVEIALQMIMYSHRTHMVIATPSNSAADLIATRILELRDCKNFELVRLVSFNVFERDLIPAHLAPYSCTVDRGLDGTCSDQNITTDEGVVKFATQGYLEKFRVIVATCGTMSNLLHLGFKRHHFSHAIIDEAGQCTEPESMLPMALLYKKQFQVVLAGDPNQLEAVVGNEIAFRKGLSASLLDRMLKNPLYAKHLTNFPDNCGYDPRLVTKLVHNYRAVPSVLKAYSDLFYHSELKPVLDANTSDEALLLKSLTSIPIIKPSEQRARSHGVFFHGVDAEHKRIEDSPSWYNPNEARQVVRVTQSLYQKNITASQIGIITPYARQVKHFRDIFELIQTESPKIGSVQEFQGQERDIILVSAVRSSAEHSPTSLRSSLGFIQNYRLLNVTISRARSLLIVFGNPIHLSKNKNWALFIKYCIENDAYSGCELPVALQYPLKIYNAADGGGAEANTNNSRNTDKKLQGEKLERFYELLTSDFNNVELDEGGVSSAVRMPTFRYDDTTTTNQNNTAPFNDPIDNPFRSNR